MSEDSVTLTVGELRKRKLFVATPMYGGACTGFYTSAMLDLSSLANKYGIVFRYFSLFNESLITRARNYCVDEFIRSDCTHLLFIDSDIQFNPKDALDLLAISDADSDKHILCGPYPKKNISWEKVKKAVDMGFADQNPEILENFAGDFVFNALVDGPVQLNQPIEISEGGTGFMMIQRQVFEKMAQDHPEWHYNPDHIRSQNFDGSRQIVSYFMDPIDPDTKRHLSEDYYFTQQARKSGFHVWLCPWIKLHHIGTYRFIGDLQAVLSSGSTPTADPREIKKSKMS